MGNTRSHYALLRIAPEATQAEVEVAYQRLLNYLGKKIAAGERPPIEEFERLDAAFATLRDPALRAAYDQQQRGEASNPPAIPPALPPTTPSSPAEIQDGPRNLQFAFHGKGDEYFRIWIVNLLLSIVTLGIYSAWAKVRREQYFHRNLVLDEAGFDYHANPIAILKGRIIAVLLFAAVSASEHIHPLLHTLALFLSIFVIPWLIMRSMRFRAYNSSYRGLRFAFVGTYGGALKAYVGYGFIVLITLGLCMPMWIRETHKYIINNLRYGHGEFHCELLAADIFIFTLKAWLVAMGVIMLGGVFAALLPKLIIVSMIITAIAYISVLPYIRMTLTNYVWSRAELDDNDFSSEMKFKPYFGIVLRNLLFTVLTLGLYWPWAKVNLAHYRAACTSLSMSSGLDHFMATAAEHVSAFGDAAVDIFDFDIAI